VFLERMEDRWLPSSLSGFVYDDADNNGLRDPGEAGLAGVTVTLTGTDSTSHAVSLTQRTDATGAYSFANLNAGTYALRASTPAGYLDGQATVGTQGGTAAGASLSNLVLGANVAGSGNNFGELAQSDGWSAIASNFNGTPIAAGTYLWFNSVLKVSGLGSSPVTLHFTSQVVTFAANGTTYSLAAPDSVLTFSPTATAATTTFDSSSNSWVTTLPSSFGGNAFLGGLAFPVTTALPGGINPVTWQGRFWSDSPGVSVNWQWAAAVYTSFSTNYAALDVKPVDDPQLSVYKNSDHAGTPEAFRSAVIGGSRGGGGSNFTGSYSATVSTLPPQLGGLSGFVTNEGTNSGLGGVTVTLTGVNNLGQSVSLTTTTSANGAYHFGALRAGTYTLTETPPSGYVDDHNAVGTAGGASAANQFTNITLNAGVSGVNYNFGDMLFGGSGGLGGGS
jgi:hypothetical protein